MVASPRQILRAQLDAARRARLDRAAGTELEFIVFRDTYEEAWHKGYRDLEPANLYNVDYSMLGTARVEPLIRRIRNSMAAADMTVENSKGECNFGQHEINFRYDSALAHRRQPRDLQDGAKEIAAQEGMSITFMAKFDEREGTRATSTVAREGGRRRQRFADDEAAFNRFVAGQLAALRELTLIFAPNVNSYKRFVAGLVRSDRCGVGHDNRTCSMRVVGHGQGLRVENRLPGATSIPTSRSRR